MVDFGADHAFGRVRKKLQEHYGINLPITTIRKVTEHHAHQLFEQEKPAQIVPPKTGCAQQIGALDGRMIPIVDIDEKDKRKNKTLRCQEARLSIVHEQGSVSAKFGAVFQGSVDDAGQCLLNAALLAGFGAQTQRHAVGDGAPWIAQQVADKFGAQGSYLLDFYHVCEYLATVTPYCAPNQTAKDWLEIQKTALKNNEYRQVIQTLERYRERRSNRIGQLDYKTAIEHE